MASATHTSDQQHDAERPPHPVDEALHPAFPPRDAPEHECHDRGDHDGGECSEGGGYASPHEDVVEEFLHGWLQSRVTVVGVVRTPSFTSTDLCSQLLPRRPKPSRVSPGNRMNAR
jgi:hypothetical protein